MTTSEPRVALLTGATRGIGNNVAERLARNGWTILAAARDADALTTTARRLVDLGARQVVPAATNLAEESAVKELAAMATELGVDTVILNAGMGSIGAFSDFPARRLDRLYAVNVRSAYVLVQALLPALRAAAERSEFGAKVIALASTTGLVGEPLNSAYGATKAALISLCETLNTEASGLGITATAVCPGYVATDMTENLGDEELRSTMLSPDDVAKVVVSLLDLSARCVVPQVALVRPGRHMWRA